VARNWRRLHNEELHSLYVRPNIIRETKARRMGWVGNVARMGDMRNVHKILVGKSEGKRPLGRPRCSWEDNIRMNLREIWWQGVDWVHLAQDIVAVNTVMKLRVL
jgi:hypothetical protein